MHALQHGGGPVLSEALCLAQSQRLTAGQQRQGPVCFASPASQLVACEPPATMVIIA